ncbi:VOC family protein [Altererythrobacter sp. ZODW24]|uniref:VOC family protein n=1 Tax=Altererythrobacter sp. ZODW24 TaxID=2185142 RepID=UPI000DF8548D|nr:VOC family protein [Altererythrobacter sp. ZODW24]
MKLGRLNHIGVATPSIADSIAFYRETMGATSIVEPFELEGRHLLVAFIDTPTDSGMNGTQIELIEPLEGDTALTGFLQKNPLGGQHHLCYEVEDIAAAREWFEGQGKRILGPTRIGAHGTPIFFVHPKDMMGQLTEIMETPKEAH